MAWPPDPDPDRAFTPTLTLHDGVVDYCADEYLESLWARQARCAQYPGKTYPGLADSAGAAVRGRPAVIEWIDEVCAEFHQTAAIRHAIVEIYDRFVLSHTAHLPGRLLQPYACAALLLGADYYNCCCNTIPIHELYEATNSTDSCSVPHIQAKERELLDFLEFRLHTVSCFDFIQIYTLVLKEAAETRPPALVFTYPRSEAAAAAAAAATGAPAKKPPWLGKYTEWTEYYVQALDRNEIEAFPLAAYLRAPPSFQAAWVCYHANLGFDARPVWPDWLARLTRYTEADIRALRFAGEWG